MKYEVIWTPEAEQELAAIWLNTGQRMPVTRAAHAIDQALREGADTKGESRAGDARILIEAP